MATRLHATPTLTPAGLIHFSEAAQGGPTPADLQSRPASSFPQCILKLPTAQGKQRYSPLARMTRLVLPLHWRQGVLAFQAFVAGNLGAGVPPAPLPCSLPAASCLLSLLSLFPSPLLTSWVAIRAGWAPHFSLWHFSGCCCFIICFLCTSPHPQASSSFPLHSTHF